MRVNLETFYSLLCGLVRAGLGKKGCLAQDNIGRARRILHKGCGGTLFPACVLTTRMCWRDFWADIAIVNYGLNYTHFQHSGAWNLSDPTHRSNCTCARMEPRMAETNHVVVRALSSSDRLLFLPLYDLRVQRHDMQACKRIGGNQSNYALTGCCNRYWNQAARLLNLLKEPIAT
eukprot:jgi/Chlat1/1526/Chrsp122S01815